MPQFWLPFGLLLITFSFGVNGIGPRILQHLARTNLNKIGQFRRALSSTAQIGQIGQNAMDDNTSMKDRQHLDANSITKNAEYEGNKIVDFQNAFRKFTNILGAQTVPPKNAVEIDQDDNYGQFMQKYGQHIAIEDIEEHGQEKRTMILYDAGDWSENEAEQALLEFVGRNIEYVSEIRGLKGAKYAQKFFDKIIEIVLQHQPETVPKMMFLTEPMEWPDQFIWLAQNSDEGSPVQLALPEIGAKFKCIAERFNRESDNRGLGAYAQYIFQKEGAKGDFMFRLYYDNRSPKDQNGVKFIGFELIPHNTDG